jgi:hypothetical protein
VFTVRGTKKFLDRVGRPVVEPPASTTVLGDWYANVLYWRPQVALFVNATTFLPVLMPLAPAAGVLARCPGAMSEVIHRLGIDPRFAAGERESMHDVTLAKTASRQVLGVMNEFTFMAERSIGTGKCDPSDLLDLSVWLANTIVGPLTIDVGYTPLGALQQLVTTVSPG